MAAKIKLERRSLGEQVTDLLRSMIITGEFKEGERLVEEQLAGRIGASRTPVREALHRLEQEELVTRRKTGGYEVRPISDKEVAEVVGVRAALESYAVELATERISADQLKKLTQNVDQFEKALREDNQDRLITLNTSFHEMLYQAADSSILTKLINGMHDVLHRFRVALLSDPETARRSLEDHRKLLQAVKNKQPEEAALACKNHIIAGGDRILAVLLPKEDGNHE